MTTKFSDSNAPWTQPDWISRTADLLNSYEKWTGRPLIERTNRVDDSRSLYEAPFVVVAHGTEDDPLLNYGNRVALELWKMSLTEFLGTPSRTTAEPVHRDERAALLQRTRRDGFIDDYSGIRIASTGERFRIHRATVWNVVDATDRHIGQAAAFAEWTPVD